MNLEELLWPNWFLIPFSLLFLFISFITFGPTQPKSNSMVKDSVLTLTILYSSPLYSPNPVQAKLQFPLYFCISQESPHYFPTHTPLPHTVKVHNLQDSHRPHHLQKRTKNLSLKTFVHWKQIGWKGKTSCFRPPLMKRTFSLAYKSE